MSDQIIVPTRSTSFPMLDLLWRDKGAFVAVVVLIILLLCCLIGPLLLGFEAKQISLKLRNIAPFSLERGWLFVLGTDAVGRSILARLVVGSSYTLMIAFGAAIVSGAVGGLLGIVAGLNRGVVSGTILRVADVVMSFPSLLLALVVLYVLGGALLNVIIVLAITRIPLYLRVARAEVLEVRERMFVKASQVMGARPWWVITRHIAPTILPTMLTLAALDVSFLILAESSLSFLGLGVQPPDITWGLMVAEGRNYLKNAWWISFWPGLAIAIATIALNIASNWLRLVMDPRQRWRLEAPPK